MSELEIGGIVFTAEDVYAEGDTLTASEAKALNQLRRENLRNNFRKKVKDAGDNPTSAAIAALKTEFASISETYEFAGQRAPRVTRDPVLAIAKKLAKTMVRTGLKKKNIDIDTMADGLFDKLVAQCAERPDVMAEAKRQVEATKAIAELALDDAA